MKILVIEGDKKSAATIRVALEREGHRVVNAGNGEDGLAYGTSASFCAIVLGNGYTDIAQDKMLAKLRAANVNSAIIVIGSSPSIADKVGFLNAGADDYLVKPADNDELNARLYATHRRYLGYATSIFEIGDLRFNLERKTVTREGAQINLTRREYAMVECLLKRQGTTYSKEALLNNLYGGMDEPELKIIDVFICKLRKKLGLAPSGRQYVETIWGRGYRFLDDHEALPAVDSPSVQAA